VSIVKGCCNVDNQENELIISTRRERINNVNDIHRLQQSEVLDPATVNNNPNSHNRHADQNQFDSNPVSSNLNLDNQNLHDNAN